MADLVRRNGGGLVTSDAGPGVDPSSLEFSRNLLQQWWAIEDVPQAIIDQFHKKSLFPTQLILDELAAPVIEAGMVIVRGWIVGSNSFTNFQISKKESDSESKWEVTGKLTRFKSDAEVRKSLVSVDGAAAGPSKPGIDEKSQEQRLGSAHTLPSQLRRMLLSVNSPIYYYAQIWLSEPDFPSSTGDEMSYRVAAIAHNATVLVAVRAEQKIDLNHGESKASANKRLSQTSWDTRVVRAYF